ncbi:PREDICTED: nuclear nucleic acid-binding protein C1D-like [Nicrophorus vespilloides]|uniref:Nuclear nucleic acid-binding protein C1D n=1 Tax=Nicrophorus vespilloides TaxID=110193 RepID=A0ABM1NK41_NICVS|nr:PREDICTED: nuclear nucleic acid-binding protein C1D-like [Nicrophorus vespilloides]
MDFGDLKDDKEIQTKLLNLHKSVNDIEHILDVAYNSKIAEGLSMKDQMEYDLFIAYTLNTLYWLYLRVRGLDPNENEVKKEIQRVREYMVKAQTAVERHTLRKTVNVEVAERFVRHGVQVPKEKRQQGSDGKSPKGPPAKRRKHNKNN